MMNAAGWMVLRLGLKDKSSVWLEFRDSGWDKEKRWRGRSHLLPDIQPAGPVPETFNLVSNHVMGLYKPQSLELRNHYNIQY